MEPRPKTLTPEMALRVGTKLATSLAKSGHIKADDIASSAADIAKVGRPHMDGYELAKALDNLCWDCDLMMADDLDRFYSMADDEITAAQKHWAERNNVQPPYPIGTRVKTRSGSVGVLDQIYPHGVARYCVREDGDTNSTRRLIVAYEDVTPIDAETVAPQ